MASDSVWVIEYYSKGVDSWKPICLDLDERAKPTMLAFEKKSIACAVKRERNKFWVLSKYRVAEYRRVEKEDHDANR